MTYSNVSDIELFKELLSKNSDIIKFASNLKTFSGQFSSQFKFSDLNKNCYNIIYLKKDKKIIPRQEFFKSIENLESTCKECWKFYLNPRNRSIKGLDVQLGKKFELMLLDFLESKGIPCKKADVTNKTFPDNLVLDRDGNIIAYLEIKYQSAPWIWAYKEEGTKRECYEGSPALDIKKLEQQWNLVENGEINHPFYYVYWLDLPCIKGIFFISIQDVYTFYKEEAKVFERKIREGDFVDTKDGKKFKGQLKKIHISIYKMKPFGELIEMLKNEK